LGLGTWRLEGDGLKRAAEAALAAGYRHFDTAPAYHNERALGEALAASKVPREELYVTSKVWNSDQGRDLTRAACLASLEKLGLDYLDLYLIHWPVKGRSLRCWEELERLASDGLIRGAGVSNFEEAQLRWLLERVSTRPAVNQAEIHPHHAKEPLAALCRERGIHLTAYAPLARGQLNKSQNLIRLAVKHGRAVPQVILRWHLQKGRSVIPKSARPERILENAGLFDFTLDDSDMAVLDKQNQNRSVLAPRFPIDSLGFVIDEQLGSGY
jgi:diketogulonate reductase-like aldo/keto reductase